MPISRHSLDTLAGLWIGALGLASLGLQPQILLASVTTSLTAMEAGRLATLEIGAMAIASAVVICGAAGPFRSTLSGLGCALMAGGSLLAACSANIVTASAGRALAGIGEGILASAGVVAVLGSARPVRASAGFVTIAALPPLAGSVVLALIGRQIWGGNAPLLLLAAGGLLALIPVLFRRSRTPVPLPKPRPPAIGSVIVIMLLWLLNAIASACWTYLGALGAEQGLAPPFVAHSLSVGLLAQMAASILLAWRGPDARLALFLLIAVGAEGGGVLLASGAAGRPTAYLVATAIFGFALHAASPLVTGLFTQSDPTRRCSYLILPVTLLGIATGPAMASLFPDPASAFLAGGGLLIGVAVALAVFTQRPMPWARESFIAMP
ncbi:hypothetical protein [Sphingomonas abietis]|uniref:MFS transporter n=1 Tax=Sphingomonas abietis TaxID=3012344 RepID=A0ABY7NHN4_9SPHN|nr:hypothetical protein [Sphingomonas abietis]WBO21039.1 hypothetical protein PBT88_12575 [Sphingomonas abietis]